MRTISLAVIGLLLSLEPGHATPDADLEHRYLAVYLEINDAEHFEAKADLAGALKDFKECYEKLSSIQKDAPDWETALVGHRLEDCQVKIIDLEGKQGLTPDMGGPIASPSTNYPWKTNVAVELFWIGKDGAKQSVWDADWVKANGGVDSPDDRNGFSAAAHVDQLNPFYVALPFNDLAHPEAAKKWVPASWVRQPKEGKPISACKDRWVAIKSANGRTCYAQWEDAGPSNDDDAEYIFGKSAPKVEDKPALSVSPAVAQYLGLSGDATNRVAWRFITEANVPPGQWLKYDEQGLIYSAMNK